MASIGLSGGDKLKAALAKIAENASNAASVDVGFLEGATYPDGTSVPMVAAIQEFGAPAAGIPPRPFFRSMIEAKSGEWPEAVAGLLKTNEYDAAKTLDQAGASIKGQLEQSIVDTNSPPLSMLTLLIRKWKSENPDKQVSGKIIGELAAQLNAGPVNVSGVPTKPLVESGNMLASVDYRVKS